MDTAPLAIFICGDETKNDGWIEDCSIASIILQLIAQSLGLGSCWIQIRNRMHSETVSAEKYIQQIIVIPDHFRIPNLITIGYPTVLRRGKIAGELQYDKIHTNRF